ncbi:MAG: alpha/beta hydrolase [Micrococcales bacterium]|nr:alpha/beta hydrolase [Micrococcales bacterium]
MADPDDGIPVTQDGFDPLGPQVRRARLSTGRQVHYIDDGDPSWRTLLFFGGAGTTVRAFRLLEFARTLRRQLRIRVVSVERNGLGQTPFDPSVGLTEHAHDVWALLDHLGIEEASVIAISGGGPYAAHVISVRPTRIRSVHLAAAFSEALPGATPDLSLEAIAADPTEWWRFPEDSPVNDIPGFADSVIEEATRGAFALGSEPRIEGLAQAFDLYRQCPLPDLSGLAAPGFLYWGDRDTAVPLDHLRRWEAALPVDPLTRIYTGEGHDIQYRHWDQIMADVAFLGNRVVVTTAQGATMLQTPARAAAVIAAGGTLGLAAWRSARR